MDMAVLHPVPCVCVSVTLCVRALVMMLLPSLLLSTSSSVAVVMVVRVVVVVVLWERYSCGAQVE